MEFSELQKMVSRVDDNAGDHALWIDNDNIVHLDSMPCDMDNLKEIIRIYDRGEGYLGEDASGYLLNMRAMFTLVLNAEKEA